MNIWEKISINPRHDATLAHQISRQITWLIASGKLRPGDRLPGVRLLAEHLGVNLHTVRNAYKKMEVEGLVETRRGRGTHVLAFDPLQIMHSSRQERSHTVGILLPSLNNPFYQSFLLGVEEISEQEQTLLFLCNTHDDPAALWRSLAQLSSKQVDGILVLSQDISAYAAMAGETSARSGKMPFVTVDWPGSTGYSVSLDLESAGYQAARHLLAHGHRRIGLITFGLHIANVKPIHAGYFRALAESGLRENPELIAGVHGFDPAAGESGARNLLNLPQPPSAIFAIADTLALGAMKAIKQAGLHIPEDIALVGFNDIPLAAMVEPSLTTIAAPAIELGREAMKMLQMLIAGKQPAPRSLILPTSLVIRESCGVHT